MASFSTVITEFSDKENSRTYSIAGHTVQKPMLLIQKRKVPATQESNASSEIQVVFGTEDANGDLLASKVVFVASCRYPANAISADIAAALADFRDFVASDEFTATVSSQDYLQ